MSEFKISDIIENMCVCVEEHEVLSVFVKALEWASSDSKSRCEHDKVFENVGVYYIVMGYLDKYLLIEHGTSVRHPWITDRGRAALAKIKAVLAEPSDTLHLSPE